MTSEKELINTALADDLTKLTELLEVGANPNIFDEHGLPLLLRLVLEKKQQAAEILLEKGADPNVPNKYGYNILYDSNLEEHVATMKFLLDHGADPNKKYLNGMTPTNITLETGSIPMFKLLMEYSKDKEAIFSTNSKGETILHLAAQQNDINTFNEYKNLLLTKAKDGMNLPDKLGYTPLYWSKLLEHKEITQELNNYALFQNIPAYTKITASESYKDLPPRSKVAVSYNTTIGGKTSQEVLKRLTECYSEAVPIDYREIVAEQYNNEIVNLDKIKKEALEKATMLLADKDALIIPGNNSAVAPETATYYGGETNSISASDKARSFAEMIMVEVAINKGMPIMGLCGGHQVINAYLGGKIESLTEKTPGSHDHNSIIIEPFSELAPIIKQTSNIKDNNIPRQNFWAAHGDIVKDIGGKNRINNNKDLLKITAKTSDGEIEATESQFGTPILTFQFHPEMTEDKGPKLNFSIEEILRDRKIFSLFLKSAEIFAYKKELINEIEQLKLNIKPLANKDINTTSSEASLKKTSSSLFRR